MMAKPRARHPQTLVEYDGNLIEVDTGIVPLLEAMWASGFRTYASCEDHGGGDARIWFSDPDHQARFIELSGGSPVSGSHWPVDFHASRIPEIIALILG